MKNSKEENKPKFVYLMNETTLKTLWTSKDKDVKNYLVRMINSIVGFDVSDFKLESNESILSITQDKIENKDTITKINFIFNEKYSFTLEHKGEHFISSLLDDKEAKRILKAKTKPQINVIEINFVGFGSSEPGEMISEVFYLGLGNKISHPHMTIHNIYLADIKDLALKKEKSKDNLDINDIAMLSCDDYEEMEEFAKGNKEREKVIETLKKLSQNKKFIPFYLQSEFEKMEYIKAKIALFEYILNKRPCMTKIDYFNY